MPKTSFRPARTRILATLGPASLKSKPEAFLQRLLTAGADGFRLNFSHGDATEHLNVAAAIRRLRSHRAAGPIFVLQDLPGPKLRLGDFGPQPRTLRKGQVLTLLEGEKAAGDAIPVEVPGLAQALRVGDRILIGDGETELRVVEIEGLAIHVKVANGKEIKSHKGFNTPPGRLSIGALTDVDRKYLSLDCAGCFDLTALSFVRDADDLITAREMLAKHDPDRRLVAKLERQEALDNLPEILAAADAVMVARGDLGLELPPEKVPVQQRRIIRAARAAGKPVIVATQMLESMITTPRPTRAEVSDIAAAVWEGADCLMLSAETASGDYPLEAVTMMERTIRAAEAARVPDLLPVESTIANSDDALARAALDLADAVKARTIAVATRSGATALRIARYRKPIPLLAVTHSAATEHYLALAWGTFPMRLERIIEPKDFPAVALALAVDRGMVGPGDRMVLLYGHFLAESGVMQALQVHVVEEKLVKRGRAILA